MTELPTYWTDDLKGLTVFDVILDTVEKYPEVLSEIEAFIERLKESEKT